MMWLDWRKNTHMLALEPKRLRSCCLAALFQEYVLVLTVVLVPSLSLMLMSCFCTIFTDVCRWKAAWFIAHSWKNQNLECLTLTEPP